MNAGAAEKQQQGDESIRERRGRGIVAMKLVERRGDTFYVKSPSTRQSQQTFEVRRDSTGRVICTCSEFEENNAAQARFRCEHIYAVKFWLGSREESCTNAVASKPATGALSDEAALAAGSPLHILKEVPAVEPYNTSATSHDVDSPASLKSDTEHSTSSEINFQPEIHTDARESQPAEVIQLNSFPATLKRLKQRIDPSLVKTREGSVDHTGTTQIIEYVEWHVVADILDRIAPTWQHHIRSVTQIGSFVAVTAAITIDGISREGVGTGTTANETGIKKAEHDALKRAAVKFGIARELYRREAAIIDREGSTMSPGEVEG